MTHSPLHEYLAHGQTPFFRLPLPDAASPEQADAVIFGVPYDGGTTYQPGARLGPYHVRRLSGLVQPFHPEFGIDPFQTIAVADGGNVPAPPFNAGAMREFVQGRTAQIVGSGARPYAVGGDHSITLPILRALTEKHGPVAVVHFDAHFDTSDDSVWGEAYHHGTPIRHALAEGLIAEQSLFQIGIRGTYKDPTEADFAASHGARLITAEAVADTGPRQLGQEIVAAVGERPVYITLDVDGIDPAFAPGTGTPVPGGLTSREAISLMRSLAGLNVVGMDLVEIAPAMDHADATSLLGAHLLYEGIALAARFAAA